MSVQACCLAQGLDCSRPSTEALSCSCMLAPVSPSSVPASAADTHMGHSASNANHFNSGSSANPYTQSPGHEQVYGQGGHVTQGVCHALTAAAVGATARARCLSGKACLSRAASPGNVEAAHPQRTPLDFRGHAIRTSPASTALLQDLWRMPALATPGAFLFLGTCPGLPSAHSQRCSDTSLTAADGQTQGAGGSQGMYPSVSQVGGSASLAGQSSQSYPQQSGGGYGQQQQVPGNGSYGQPATSGAGGYGQPAPTGGASSSQPAGVGYGQQAGGLGDGHQGYTQQPSYGSTSGSGWQQQQQPSYGTAGYGQPPQQQQSGNYGAPAGQYNAGSQHGWSQGSQPAGSGQQGNYPSIH